MNFDLSQMEEVRCSDCQQQLVIAPVTDKPGRYKLEGCRCGREEFTLPDCIAAGIKGAPLFLYKKKSNRDTTDH